MRAKAAKRLVSFLSLLSTTAVLTMLNILGFFALSEERVVHDEAFTKRDLPQRCGGSESLTTFGEHAQSRRLRPAHILYLKKLVLPFWSA